MIQVKLQRKPMLTEVKYLGMKYANPTSKQKCAYSLYRCDCGEEVERNKGDVNRAVKKGFDSNCGCKSHGGTGTRIYRIFGAMHDRCENVNRDNYSSYGGRGIRVCDEWSDFKVFRAWALANGYAANLSIDRKNVDGNYDPGNCRWATNTVQTRNRSIQPRNKTGYIGVFKRNDVKTRMFTSYITINKKRIVIGRFDTAIEAHQARANYIIDNKLEDFK